MVEENHHISLPNDTGRHDEFSLFYAQDRATDETGKLGNTSDAYDCDQVKKVGPH